MDAVRTSMDMDKRLVNLLPLLEQLSKAVDYTPRTVVNTADISWF